jgi:hypothetical protein
VLGSLAAFSNSNFLTVSRMSRFEFGDVGVEFGLGGEVRHAYRRRWLKGSGGCGGVSVVAGPSTSA